MKFSINVKSNAVDRLDLHIEFLANVSEAAAVGLFKEYVKSLKAVSENPYMYRRYESNESDNLRYKLFYKNRFRMVYEIVEKAIYVYDIQDCRQNTDKNLI